MIKRFLDRKIWVVTLTCLAVLLMVLLAAGLGDIHFQPGRPLAMTQSTTIQLSFDQIVTEIKDIPLAKLLGFWGLVILLVIILASLFSPEMRKRIILFFLRFGLFALVVFYILRKSFSLFQPVEPGGSAAAAGPVAPGAESVPAVFSPPHVSSTLLYLISLGVVLVLTAMAFLAGRWWLRKQRLQGASQPLDGLAEIARSSLADISSGSDWEDVIIKSYARMNQVVQTQRGLQRQHDLTASEFAARLEQAGLPGEAVRRLTRLFEAARYGARNASREEKVEAVSCLSMVLHACGVNE